MHKFKIHMAHGAGALVLQHDARSLEDINFAMLHQRCLIGDLVEEGGEIVDPPIRILIPAPRICLVAEY